MHLQPLKRVTTSRMFSFIGLSLVIIAALHCGGCKTAKIAGDFVLWLRAGFAERYVAENETCLWCGSAIHNKNEVSAEITRWSFRIFAGDEFLFGIDDFNQELFNFKVTVVHVPAASGRMYYYDYGWVDVYSAYWTGPGDDSKVWCCEPGDIFKGKIPDKFQFACTLLDENGFYHNLQTEGPFAFEEFQNRGEPQ